MSAAGGMKKPRHPTPLPLKGRSDIDLHKACRDILRELKKTEEYPPFLMLAAERAGYPRNQVRVWVKTGMDTVHSLLTPWLSEVLKVQAKYTSILTQRLLDPDLSTSARNGVISMLKALERDYFNPPKQVTEVVPFQQVETLEEGQVQLPVGDLDEFLAGDL